MNFPVVRQSINENLMRINLLKNALAELGQLVNAAVPTGGTTGQVLAKASDNDHDTEWVDPSGGGASWTTIFDGAPTEYSSMLEFDVTGYTSVRIFVSNVKPTSTYVFLGLQYSSDGGTTWHTPVNFELNQTKQADFGIFEIELTSASAVKFGAGGGPATTVGRTHFARVITGQTVDPSMRLLYITESMFDGSGNIKIEGLA